MNELINWQASCLISIHFFFILLRTIIYYIRVCWYILCPVLTVMRDKLLTTGTPVDLYMNHGSSLWYLVTVCFCYSEDYVEFSIAMLLHALSWSNKWLFQSLLDRYSRNPALSQIVYRSDYVKITKQGRNVPLNVSSITPQCTIDFFFQCSIQAGGQ